EGVGGAGSGPSVKVKMIACAQPAHRDAVEFERSSRTAEGRGVIGRKQIHRPRARRSGCSGRFYEERRMLVYADAVDAGGRIVLQDAGQKYQQPPEAVAVVEMSVGHDAAQCRD